MRKEEELGQLRETKRENNHNFLKVSTLDNKLSRSQVTDIFHSNVNSHLDPNSYSNANSHFDPDSYSNIKTSYIFDVAATEPPNSKEVANMEEDLQNMEQNLKSLSKALNKPTRTYQFVTKAR